MVEIYNYNISDSNFREDMMEISNELDIYLSQIRMAINTEKGEVLGIGDFGFDLEAEIYDFKLNERKLRSKIMSQIERFCSLHTRFKTNISVKFMRGDVRDIALIDFHINGNKMIGYLIK